MAGLVRDQINQILDSEACRKRAQRAWAFEGRSYHEIAGVLGADSKTADSALQRARRKFAKVA